MKPIVFFDTEVDPASQKLKDIGACRESGAHFHKTQLSDFADFVQGVPFIAGHNVFRHDLKYIQPVIGVFPGIKVIDTLVWAPLLFPSRPYHRLVKDDKLQVDEINNPLNDAIKAKELFYEQVNAFNTLNENFKVILYGLLSEAEEYRYFFEYVNFNPVVNSLSNSIKSFFAGKICENVNLEQHFDKCKVELAYCLSLINATDQYSIMPRWLQFTFPEFIVVMRSLRSEPCQRGCAYCDQENNAKSGLRSFFGYSEFRTFEEENLQEEAVNAALKYRSLLAVFPTGGGKSITFQLPALMQGNQNKGLTVVISPLQSLMKDQVDNLEKKGIISAVTLNGLQDPIERRNSLTRVEDGQAHLLYISPESLRSPSVERILQARHINRFVIDEAHCFSSWGHDFRVDYLYIGEFIRKIREKRQQQDTIPVSCFTATAKPQVIDDIANYFDKQLNITLDKFQSSVARKNLSYTVYKPDKEEGKYSMLRELLTQYQVPSIVYVSRTKRAQELAEKLTRDGLHALPYHGKLESKQKSKNQDAFLGGEVNIMVATSAFGMGVDKHDIGSVIHYEISDSLENYVQEAGRAGRDENLHANCFILFDEEDLNNHFILQNQTRLTRNEINQVWKAIKDLTKFRMTLSQSALDIARRAGWDDSVNDLETRIKTAVTALEQAGYLKRGNNHARIFADSLQFKTSQDAIDKISQSSVFSVDDKTNAIRIIKSLISSKYKSIASTEQGEARVDYLAESLGIPLSDVIRVITLLRQENLLSDACDLNAFISSENAYNKIRNVVIVHANILNNFLEKIESDKHTIRLKEFCKQVQDNFPGSNVMVKQIRATLHFLVIKGWLRMQYRDPEKNIIAIKIESSRSQLHQDIHSILTIAPAVVNYLIEKAKLVDDAANFRKVDFSVIEIWSALQHTLGLQMKTVAREDVESAIFYLTRIDALTIEGGFLVIYQRIMIERLEENFKVQYKTEDYKELERFYKNKIQQVHIVGEYAKRMIENYKDALQFVDDYFRLNYQSFLKKYFKGRDEVIQQTLTPSKMEELLGPLSITQSMIVKDDFPYTAVLAGPGSGKTKVLVHKLAVASLLENLKHEQILMLTFSRSAVTEFKERLYELIGNAAAFIQIKTFHSYCFDLLGRQGDIKNSENVIRNAIQSISEDRVEKNRLTKLLLLVDEAQDMSREEYDLILEIKNQNEGLRIILVGDDDQNIYEFRNSSSVHLESFINDFKAKQFELLENFRSKPAIVDFTNRYALTISGRLKKTQIFSNARDDGDVRILQIAGGSLTSAVSEVVAMTDLVGTTAILCQENDEASEIHSALVKLGLHAKLIVSIRPTTPYIPAAVSLTQTV